MSAAFGLGSFLAIYYFVGRWTFARLDGDYALVPMIEQPRFWLVALLVAMAGVIQSGIPRSARQFRPTGVDLTIFVFLGYMLLTGIWAQDAELARDKAFEISLILTVAMVVAVSRSCRLDEQMNVGFWTTIVVIGVALGGLALLRANDSRTFAPGGGPNTFARNMGLTAFGTLFLASRYGILLRISSIALVATAALLVVRCGSRGGLLSFTLAAATHAIAAKTGVVKKLLIVGVMVAATALALFYTDAGQQAVEVFTGRIIEQTVENRHLAGRDDLWFRALEMAQERPFFGWGLNGFRANSWNYPHNIFMEVTVEGGIVGLLLLLNVGRSCWRQLRRQRLRIVRTHLAALVLTFAAAQTSGDLFDSRGVFLMLALSMPLDQLPVRRPLWREAPLPMSHRRPAPTGLPVVTSSDVEKPLRQA